MRLRNIVVGAVTAVSMLSAGCGIPEASGENPEAAMAQSQDALQAAKGAMGLGADHVLLERASMTDESGATHTRYDHFFRGVRVFEGDVVSHHAAGGRALVSGFSHRDIRADVNPTLKASDALAIAHERIRPMGPYVRAPEAELVLVPNVVERVSATPMRGPGGELTATDIEQTITGYTLAYQVSSALENGAAETRHVEQLIDAKTGSLIKEWSSLQTAAATGTGNSQYSGTVSIGTNTVTGGWEMRDVARTMNYATYNLNHATTGTGSIYTDADNTWGDSANYVEGSSTTAANGQTAAVDAHYGIGKTFDYYKNIHGRNGIDGAGRATYNRVHYSNSYDNAFWDDTCFCMTYGDGSSFTTLTSLDVAGHEMTHGVTSRTAALTYSGESGGLNESTSDIHGTMVEFYARGGGTTTVPATGGNWTIGEQLSASPLRYMYKPSLDGSSPNAWSSTIGSLDVHYSSGPSNRMFYFLSQGSSSSSTSNYYSSYLPGGMTGIGNDHAARIAYKALTAYMTSSTNYAGARTAFLNAASALYGSTSADYAAVQNAFAAINVGAPAGGGGGGGGGGTSLQNGGFENGTTNPIWTASAGVIDSSTSPAARSGSWKAYLDGYGSTHTDTLSQTFTVPSTATTLTFWLRITTAETTTSTAYDKLTVQLKNSAGTVVATQTFSNLNASTSYAQKSFTVSSYRGQAVTIAFTGTEDSSLQTSFLVDDASVQ